MRARWYHARQHVQELVALGKSFMQDSQKLYGVLDLFSSSQKVRQTFQKAGVPGMAFDIKHSLLHDICTKSGFERLLRMGCEQLVRSFCIMFYDVLCLCNLMYTYVWLLLFMYVYVLHTFPYRLSHLRLRDDGLIVAAPPCSLYGPACASVHKRSALNPAGDLSNFKVRLARVIHNNFVPWQIQHFCISLYVYNLIVYICLYSVLMFYDVSICFDSFWNGLIQRTTLTKWQVFGIFYKRPFPLPLNL